ncbi:MAG: hypothetical protein ACK4FV_06510, partial [Candidatus Nitrosocaldus sp.]
MRIDGMVDITYYGRGIEERQIILLSLPIALRWVGVVGLDVIDKSILASIYINYVSNSYATTVNVKVKKKILQDIGDHNDRYLPSSVIAEHRKRLESLGMIKDGMLTELGRSA